MSLVAILGAGEVGGAVARVLASRARVDIIRLIDEQSDVAAGKALDLRQAGPIGGSDTRIEGTSDLAAAAGAAAIVLADSAASSRDQPSEYSGETGLTLVRRLGRLGCLGQSVLICAGADHRALMQQAFDELPLSRRHIIGSAPEALAATARALVGVEAQVSASQVMLTVIGKPPARMIVLWSEASIGGHSIPTLLSAPQLHRVETQLQGLWPPGPAALGSAAALFCEAVVTGSRRIFSAFVALDRDNGTRAPVCAWPVSLGPAGLGRVTAPSLTGRDRVVMDEVLE
jgi:malate dehydrogenase